MSDHTIDSPFLSLDISYTSSEENLLKHQVN